MISLLGLLTLTSFSGLIHARAEESTCGEFPEKLERCVASTCLYKHLLTRQLYTRKLERIANKCRFVEEWPNDVKLVCDMKKGQTKSMAHYYRRFDNASDIAYNPETHPKSGVSYIELKVDGKILQNVPEEFIQQKICHLDDPSEVKPAPLPPRTATKPGKKSRRVPAKVSKPSPKPSARGVPAQAKGGGPS